MRIAIAVLCIGAVTFLLRVLVALLREGMNLPSQAVKFYLAKFSPSGRRGELIVMSPQSRGCEYPTGTDQRIAL